MYYGIKTQNVVHLQRVISLTPCMMPKKLFDIIEGTCGLLERHKADTPPPSKFGENYEK